MAVVPITKEEAIHRIREGRHAEFESHVNPDLDRAMIQGIEAGYIEAGLTEDGKLAFSLTDAGILARAQGKI